MSPLLDALGSLGFVAPSFHSLHPDGETEAGRGCATWSRSSSLVGEGLEGGSVQVVLVCTLMPEVDGLTFLPQLWAEMGTPQQPPPAPGPLHTQVLSLTWYLLLATVQGSS